MRIQLIALTTMFAASCGSSSGDLHDDALATLSIDPQMTELWILDVCPRPRSTPRR